MKTVFVTSLLVLISTFTLQAATRYSVMSGNWSNNATWSGNQVPQCGDSIIIQGGHTVTIVSQETYNCIVKIVLKGNLYFSSGNKLNLLCGSQVFVFPNGEVASPANGSSNRINICGLEYWSSANGKLTGPSCMPASSPNCAGLLPVELASFVAKNREGAVCLKWTTASERNSSHFVIEKLQHGKFVAIDSVFSIAKNGDSKKALNYSFTDSTATEGVNYYRLKQVDTDQKFDYSKIITIQIDAISAAVSVFPNPNNGTFFVRCDNERNSETTVLITNSFGKIIFENIFTESEMSVSGLTSGIYFITIQNAGVKKVQRIVVQ
jgi:hypothetical protein